jgi:hypothetical protein
MNKYFLCTLLCFALAFSNDWRWISHPLHGNSVSDIFWDSERAFAAAGPHIMYSDDGISWDLAEIDGSARLSGITQFGEAYIAVGSSVLTSTDGLNWQQASGAPDTLSLSAVACNDTRAVAVGRGGCCVTSPDGENWTEQDSITAFDSYDLYDITWAESLFVAVGDFNDVYTSPDGEIWTEQDAYEDGYSGYRGVAYSGSHLAVVGSGCEIYSSADGVIWERTNEGRNGRLSGVAWGDGRFAAVGSNVSSRGVVMTSDGTGPWDTLDISETEALYDICRTDSLWLAASRAGLIYHSRDLVSFAPNHTVPTLTLFDVRYNGDYFLICGEDGTLRRSVDGITWDTLSFNTPSDINRLHWTGTNWVAGGEYGYLYTSPDGVSWNRRIVTNSPEINEFIQRGDTLWAFTDDVFGDRAQIFQSLDQGNSWELMYAFDSEQALVAGSIGNGRILGVTQWGDIWANTGSDSALFEKIDAAEISNDVTDIHFFNDQFIAVGDSGMICTSTDGILWDSLPRATTAHILRIQEVAGRLWCMGVGGVLMSSADGLTWQEEAGLPALANAVATNGEGWLAVGYNGAVWAQGDFIPTSIGSTEGTAERKPVVCQIQNRRLFVRNLSGPRPDEIRIFSLDGRQVLRRSSTRGIGEVSLEGLAPGTYVAQIVQNTTRFQQVFTLMP